MRTTNRGIIMLGLFAAGLALSLFALQGRQAASAAPGPSDLKVETTCEPNVVRPGEWVAWECLSKVTNTSDEPMPNVSTAWKSSSGVLPAYYWVLFEIDGTPRPIEPQALATDATALQPGQSINVRLVTLQKMPAEGALDLTWPTLVDGEPVPGTGILRFEAKAGAELPPEDLIVRQISYRKGSEAVFNTTITNVSDSTISDLAFTERYGQETKLVDTSFTPTESNTNASIVQWKLASSDKKSLAPGESVRLQTVYDSLYGGDVESGVLVEATVNGEKEMYGDRADPVCTSCGTENSPPAVAPGSDIGQDVPLLPPATTGSQAVVPPNAGEGSSGDSEMMLCAVLLAAAVSLTGTVIVAWRKL